MSIEWPIDYTIFNCFEDKNEEVRLYPLRMPENGSCDECQKKLNINTLAYMDCYWDDEVGYVVCTDCFDESEESAQAIPRDPQAVDMRYVTAVSSNDHVEWDTAKHILLPPHSDNGFPRTTHILTDAQGHKAASATITFDLGQDNVKWNLIKVHNWYHVSYPSTLQVEISDSDIDGKYTIIKVDDLAMISQWVDIEISDIQTARYVRLTFANPFSGKVQKMSLGVIQFCLECPHAGCETT